ncbi:MAG TPA: NAD(P)/FAD-dependent oxidoreductase [Solirubrobacteraceae bacterium]|jgi:NADH dehydrogenase
MAATSASPQLHRVVVVGGGFGGLQVARGLRRDPVQVTLVDSRNFHLFQPLTYQVATGALSPGEIAYPLRALFKSASNVRVLLADVTGFDLTARRISLAVDAGGDAPDQLEYDTLVVAAGSSYSYFGHDEWRDKAREVKSLESAVAVRSQILSSFERAELETSQSARSAEMTFVVVGGGPTGVEIAGQIGELARDTLARDFNSINSRDARIMLVETADRLLTAFPASLSARAAQALEQLGVTPTLKRTVTEIDEHGVSLQGPDGAHERVAARTVIWAAGVRASDLASRLGEQSGADVDTSGRVTVEPDLTLPGHPEVIALGDMVRVRDPQGGVLELPGVAPVAIQQGHYATRLIADRLQGRPTRPFRYLNKGNLATIGRGRAVADLGLIRLSGPLAWLIWLFVHIFYLIGFQNRLLVMLRWSISFVTRGRGSRIIVRDWERQPARIGSGDER